MLRVLVIIVIVLLAIFALAPAHLGRLTPNPLPYYPRTRAGVTLLMEERQKPTGAGLLEWAVKGSNLRPWD